MGGYVWVDDEDEDEETTPPVKVSDLPEGARKHYRKVERELAEAKKKLAEQEKAVRVSSVADVVKAKGFDPKVAGLIPSDLAVDAVEKWLDDNGSMFAKATTEDPGKAPEPSTMDPMISMQMEQIGQITSRGVSPTGPDNLIALINGTDSKEALDKLLAPYMPKS